MAPPESSRRGIRLTAGIVLLIAVVFVAGFFWATTRERTLSPEELQAHGALMFEAARKLPEFSLRDDTGAVVSPSWFEGRWNIVFFGYTFCPDICPTTLALLRQYYATLSPEQQADTRIVLATVDPARDTVEQLSQYLGFFHPDFRGLTGEFLEVHRLATSLGSPFTKVPNSGENYLVDHSGNLALVNPAGHFVGIVKTPVTVEKLERIMPTFRVKRG